MQENNVLKRIGTVETDTGLIALFATKEKKHWTEKGTGILKEIRLCGKRAKQFTEKMQEKGYHFFIENEKITYLPQDEEQTKSLLSLLNKWQPLFIELHENSQDRILLEHDLNNEEFCVHSINPEKTSGEAYIAYYGSGLYNIYETNKGIECWKNESPYSESDLYETIVIGSFALEKDEKFVFENPRMTHGINLSNTPFTLLTGEYEIEVGLNGDKKVQVLRVIQKKNNPFISARKLEEMNQIKNSLNALGISLTKEKFDEFFETFQHRF